MNPFGYVHQYQSVRSGLTDIPAWGRSLLVLLALPGLVLAALSIVMLLVSIIALLLLTVPVYRLLRLVCFSRPMAQESGSTVEVSSPSPGRRQVDAKVIE